MFYLLTHFFDHSFTHPPNSSPSQPKPILKKREQNSNARTKKATRTYVHHTFTQFFFSNLNAAGTCLLLLLFGCLLKNIVSHFTQQHEPPLSSNKLLKWAGAPSDVSKEDPVEERKLTYFFVVLDYNGHIVEMWRVPNREGSTLFFCWKGNRRGGGGPTQNDECVKYTCAGWLLSFNFIHSCVFNLCLYDTYILKLACILLLSTYVLAYFC